VKRRQNKFHAHTMSHSQVIRSKKVKLILQHSFFPLHRYFIETTAGIDMRL